jgi:hypothetical protein
MSLSINSTPIHLTPREELLDGSAVDDLAEELSQIQFEDLNPPNMASPNDNTELLHILAQLAAQNLDRGAAARAIKWPEWNGKKESYSLFKWTIESKIEQEHGKLGSNKAICTNIFTGLPQSKQQRVIYWLQSGGESGDYSPAFFLEHMDEKFLDREEERTSLDKLDRLRQGNKQKFEDFRQQFEQLVARAGSLAPTGAAKIAVMRRSLSPALSKLLITVELSNTIYDQYVSRIQSVSTNFESHLEFKRQTGSSKHYYSSDNHQHSSSQKSSLQSTRDAEGDTPMIDVSAVVAQVLAQMNSKQNKSSQKDDSRPRAEWLSPDVFKKLVEQGKCTRCKLERKGNERHKCKYRPALRPTSHIAAVKPEEKEASSQSEGESDTPSRESENE